MICEDALISSSYSQPSHLSTVDVKQDLEVQYHELNMFPEHVLCLGITSTVLPKLAVCPSSGQKTTGKDRNFLVNLTVKRGSPLFNSKDHLIQVVSLINNQIAFHVSAPWSSSRAFK